MQQNCSYRFNDQKPESFSVCSLCISWPGKRYKIDGLCAEATDRLVAISHLCRTVTKAKARGALSWSNMFRKPQLKVWTESYPIRQPSEFAEFIWHIFDFLQWIFHLLVTQACSVLYHFDPRFTGVTYDRWTPPAHGFTGQCALWPDFFGFIQYLFDALFRGVYSHMRLETDSDPH